MIALYLWIGGVVTYAFLRASNVIQEPQPRLEPAITKETDYELFRRESIKNGFSFDGIHTEHSEYFITRENCPPVKWLGGLRTAWAWTKVPTDKLSMKTRIEIVEVNDKKVEKRVGDIFYEHNNGKIKALIYTIDLN